MMPHQSYFSMQSPNSTYQTWTLSSLSNLLEISCICSYLVLFWEFWQVFLPLPLYIYIHIMFLYCCFTCRLGWCAHSPLEHCTLEGMCDFLFCLILIKINDLKELIMCIQEFNRSWSLPYDTHGLPFLCFSWSKWLK